MDEIDPSNWNEILSFLAPYKKKLLLTYRLDDPLRRQSLIDFAPAYLDFGPLSFSCSLTSLHEDLPLSVHKKAIPFLSHEKVMEDLVLRDKNLCCYIPTGKKGKGWRIVSYLMLKGFSFCAIDLQHSILGQPTLEELSLEYRIFSRTFDNPFFFALLGSPIDKSLSAKFHNRYLENALYVKFDVQKGELASFLKKAKELPFLGFSVTMPLKEEAFSLVETDGSIGAINTIVRKEGRWIGYNVDGKAALALFPEGVKKVGIIGSGGVAKAIAFEAKIRGMQVAIFSRKREKSDFASIEDLFKWGPCILVQATPCGMEGEDPFSVYLENLDPKTTIFDTISVPRITPFLQSAKKRGHPIISGRKMFFCQAFMQKHLFIEALQAQYQNEGFYRQEDGLHQVLHDQVLL